MSEKKETKVPGLISSKERSQIVSLSTSTKRRLSNQLGFYQKESFLKKTTSVQDRQTITMHKCVQSREAYEFRGWQTKQNELEAIQCRN